MRISDWSSDVCSSDLVNLAQLEEVAKTADNTDYFFKASADPDNDSVGAYVDGANATAAGAAANASGYGASAFGSGAMALAAYTPATGLDRLGSAGDATDYGAGRQAPGHGRTAMRGCAHDWKGNT